MNIHSKKIDFFLVESSDLELPSSAKETAEKENFDLQGYQIKVGQKEQTRSARLVRIGAIQNAIQKPTTATVEEQVIEHSFSSFEKLISDLFSREMLFINVSIKC